MVFDQDEAIFKEHIAELRRSDADDKDYSIRIDDDPRVTKVGAFLRKWSIDELPNFVNVLKGSMSLVGPRPVVREEAELISLESPRFTVKPGVTGLAQIHGRDSIALSERTTWDDRYVETCSTKLDLEIMFATVGAVFVTPGDQHAEE
jgi:exopolysaccharide production protein ExoY